MSRIQSPSSINTYRQCPRKYYYQYIEKLETGSNIFLVRGNAIHEALEHFFNKVDITNLSEENYEFELSMIAHDFFKKQWIEKREDLAKLELGDPRLEFYKRESQEMLDNWLKKLFKKIKDHIKNNDSDFKTAFNDIRPVTEEYFESKEYLVRGYIDAIHEVDGKITLMDYKTSAKDYLSDDYRLQLAIYALMYKERYGKMPSRVGIDFLRHGDKHLEVDEELVEFAKKETTRIHDLTQTDDLTNYPPKKSPLCGWCSFEDTCKDSC